MYHVCFTDGEAIAKRLCSQITKTTSAVKALLKEYEKQEANTTGCRYPSKIVLEEALNINSPLWRVLETEVDRTTEVPYCIKRQLIDLHHLQKRCKEEKEIIKEEMSRIPELLRRET